MTAALLSHEILSRIFKSLELNQIARGLRVCRRWASCCWGGFIRETFKNSFPSPEGRLRILYTKYCRVRKPLWPTKILPLLLKADVNLDEGVPQESVTTARCIESFSRKEKRTMLWCAAAWGQQQVVLDLLKARASVDVCSRPGNTPLSWAVVGGHANIVKILLVYGAMVSPSDEQYKNCINVWENQDEFKNMAGMLGRPNRRCFTTLFSAAVYGHGKIMLHLIKAKGDFSMREECDVGPHGQTPLHAAARRWSQATTQTLVLAHTTAGNGIDPLDSEGCTPLMRACEGSLRTACSGGDLQLTLKELINGRANVNLACRKGLTPLMMAAQQGHVSAFGLLLDSHADPSAVTRDGETVAGMVKGNKPVHVKLQVRLQQAQRGERLLKRRRLVGHDMVKKNEK